MDLDEVEQLRFNYYRAYPVLSGVKGIAFLAGRFFLALDKKKESLREFWVFLSEELPFLHFRELSRSGVFVLVGTARSHRQIRLQSLSPIFCLRISSQALQEDALYALLKTSSVRLEDSLNCLFGKSIEL